MNKTLDILEEMLYAGMIDRAEYEAERTHYFYLVTSVHEFEEKIMEKKILLESIKKDEKAEKVDPRMKKLFNAFLDGIISEDDFIKLSWK